LRPSRWGDEDVLLNAEQLIATFEVAGAVAIDAMTQHQVLSARRCADLALSTGNTPQQLLAYTRHVPRDMVMLFKKLQEYSGDGPMTPGQVFDAMAAYSKG
jgi:hypothetical protein